MRVYSVRILGPSATSLGRWVNPDAWGTDEKGESLERSVTHGRLVEDAADTTVSPPRRQPVGPVQPDGHAERRRKADVPAEGNQRTGQKHAPRPLRVRPPGAARHAVAP